MELLFATAPLWITAVVMTAKDRWDYGRGPRPPYWPDKHGHVKPHPANRR